MMKLILFIVTLSIGLSGCATAPKSVRITDGELAGYRDIAIKALGSPLAWRKHNSALSTFVDRSVDPSREIWFDVTPGDPPCVMVWVPTEETNRPGPFVVFEFDQWSHGLKSIAEGSLIH